jgi:ABC-type transport system involved in cytochrome bd biosynthesis fused ATPase/permease subunit
MKALLTLGGDTGVRLTGPQRLQVGLARAILSPAKILILDETLSGLDEQSALVVLGNLRREIAGTRCLLYLLYGYFKVLVYAALSYYCRRP